MKNVIMTIGCMIFLLYSCSKETNVFNNSTNSSKDNLQEAGLVASACNRFAYPDSIFYPAELPDDYIVHTVKPLSGTFGCYPDELKINPFNGDIDITESETGLRYLVWYVPAGTTDTCKKFITVAGVNYTDSIYTLKDNLSIAAPVYNATPGLQIACTSNCEFDDGPDDDDGDGTADEPLAGQQVIPQGIAMNKASGAINLRRSIKNGALGTDPVAGTSKDFLLNYRISDKSNKTLNKIGFRLYYFKRRSQIPTSLMRELRAKKQQVILNNQFQANPATVSYTVNTASFSTLKEREVKCRPPYIIIVQN